MADLLFIIFVLSMLFLFIHQSCKAIKNKYVSSGDIKKYYAKKIALDVKHRRTVPLYDKNGNPYTATKQLIDGVGVYSQEYQEELKELNNITFGRHYEKSIDK